MFDTVASKQRFVPKILSHKRLQQNRERKQRRRREGGDVPDFRVRRGREGFGQAASARLVPLLSWARAGRGRRKPMEVLLSSFFLQNQKEVLLYHVL